MFHRLRTRPRHRLPPGTPLPDRSVGGHPAQLRRHLPTDHGLAQSENRLDDEFIDARDRVPGKHHPRHVGRHQWLDQHRDRCGRSRHTGGVRAPCLPVGPGVRRVHRRRHGCDRRPERPLGRTDAELGDVLAGEARRRAGPSAAPAPGALPPNRPASSAPASGTVSLSVVTPPPPARSRRCRRHRRAGHPAIGWSRLRWQQLPGSRTPWPRSPGGTAGRRCR